MAADNAKNSEDNPTGQTGELNPALQNLLRTATDITPDELAPPPYQKPQPDNPFWRFIDFVGRFAALLGGFLAVVAFLVGTLGGPDYAWTSFLYFGTLILFIIFIPAFLRKERRERQAKFEQSRANQARLKAELAQKILEQKNIK